MNMESDINTKLMPFQPRIPYQAFILRNNWKSAQIHMFTEVQSSMVYNSNHV